MKIGARLQEAAALLGSFAGSPGTERAMVAVEDALVACFEGGGKLITAGNGGSLADAMHVAEELTGRFKRDRRPLPAMACADPTHLTCVANDYGYEFVFSRLVEAFAGPGDVVALFSTSGESPSIVRAAEAGRAKGATVIGTLGKGGGAVAPLCDLVLMAPGETSDRIQELHMLAWHILIERVEVRLGLAGGGA